jgi:hypothetical protein
LKQNRIRSLKCRTPKKAQKNEEKQREKERKGMKERNNRNERELDRLTKIRSEIRGKKNRNYTLQTQTR